MSDHNIPTYYQAVQSLVGAENVEGGNTHGPIDEIVLLNDTTPPSESAIQTKLKELKAEYDTQEYARTRSPLYPDIGDQLDDLYKKGAFSDEMAAKIKKVKDDNPKPS